MSYLNKVKNQAARQRRESQQHRKRDRGRQERETAKAKRKAEDQPYAFIKIKAVDKDDPKKLFEVLSCSNCRRPIEDKTPEATGWIGSMIARFVRPQQHRPSTCPGPQKADTAPQ